MSKQATQAGSRGKSHRNCSPPLWTGLTRNATSAAEPIASMSDTAIPRRTMKSRRPRRFAAARSSSAPSSRAASRPSGSKGAGRATERPPASRSGGLTRSAPCGGEALPGGQWDLCAAVLQRGLSRLDHADDVPADPAVAGGRRVGLHGLHEVLELDLEWLRAVHVRRQDVAGSVGELVFTERGRVLVDDAVVEDPDR